jgi:hypothetical protein
MSSRNPIRLYTRLRQWSKRRFAALRTGVIVFVLTWIIANIFATVALNRERERTNEALSQLRAEMEKLDRAQVDAQKAQTEIDQLKLQVERFTVSRTVDLQAVFKAFEEANLLHKGRPVGGGPND